MTTSIRDQIIGLGVPADTADQVLTTVADWAVQPGHDFRLGLALGEALRVDPTDVDRAAMAVAAELAKALRAELPAPAPVERPALADRYATLAGGEA